MGCGCGCGGVRAPTKQAGQISITDMQYVYVVGPGCQWLPAAAAVLVGVELNSSAYLHIAASDCILTKLYLWDDDEDGFRINFCA